MICVIMRCASYDPHSVLVYHYRFDVFLSSLTVICVFIYIFLQHCGTNEPCSPLLLMERLSFEMHKTYTETRLQLHLSPASIVLVDGNEVSKQSKVKLCKQY